ncbi:MAG: NAD(P)-dependent oxidoreductase [Proteobacteria bacterium]|nr:NAD(P)-dependent oxidoreductase [Pseudomonadota bacterium]
MRIYNAEPEGYPPEARAILEGLGEVVEAECTRAQLLAQVTKADVLIVRLKHMIDTEVFDHAPSLRVIVSATTGLNHIDVAAAQARNIKVLCLKGEREFLDSITATAEHTWGLLLALVRHIPTAVQHVRDAGWDRDCFKGCQLSGLTLGIVGLGRLGTMVAEYGQVFRMRVVAYDIGHVAQADHVEMLTLPDLLASSDVVCLLPSYQESSHQLLGRREFAQMKAGAVLLNTSRGEVIDEAALLHALRCGSLAGAALDLLAGEAKRGGDWLSSHPLVEFARSSDRLLITPHIGGATYDSLRQAETFMARKLAAHLLGEA